MTMNWTKDRSIALSKACVAVFALLLAALDVYALFLPWHGVYFMPLFYINPLTLALAGACGLLLILLILQGAILRRKLHRLEEDKL